VWSSCHRTNWAARTSSDNSGICRFHRKWAELIADEIIEAHYGIMVDYKAHQFALAKAIYEREAAKSVPWQSARVADLIMGFLEQWERDGLQDPQLDIWLARFREDKIAAAHAYWEEIRRGIAEAFAAGSNAVPDMLSPGQANQAANMSGI
jgi:glyceraldehyde-3-phosphate dehydrogenase (ferredoxin)